MVLRLVLVGRADARGGGDAVSDLAALVALPEGRGTSSIERACKSCGTTFWARPYTLRRGWGNYCSNRCSWDAKKGARVVATPEVAAAAYWEGALPEPNSGCWLWCGVLDTNGYGRIYIGKAMFSAHRLAVELSGRTIAPGQFVCHRCDNPSCVNPDHLFVGSPRDNLMDAIRKGRKKTPRLCGEANPKTYLTWDKVRAIRASSETHVEIGRRMGISPATIQGIRAGRTWKEQP